ncbi:hypothetical protein TcasGA2_TC006403 [Tribolium castaneum]|uniref:Tudor domain-containing protein n=2 Tax=Tribolium castaneum TaxID=7070 RepID=D6WWL4_TRICA|nr:hypothetical protein TcasGA2_TC006403 [Tribolium castaneum]
MDTEFYNLHKALSAYKTSISTSMDKIDDIFSQAASTFINPDCARGPNPKKYTISLEIVTVLQHYIRILSTVESLADGLATKLSNLDRDAEPERETACNPFTSALLSDSKECAVSCFFHNLKAQIAERDVSSGVDSDNVSSDAETIVDLKTENLDEYARLNLFDVNVKPENAPESEISNSQKATNNSKTQIKFEVEADDSSGAETLVEQPVQGKNDLLDHSRLNPFKADSNEPKTGAKKKKTVRIKEEPPCENAEIEYTALSKLLSMSVHDRRREAQKKFENKSIKRDFNWRNVTSPPRDKKVREKFSIYDILEDQLSVGQKCVFSHIISPAEFYLRTNQALFEMLQNSLNEDMNSQHQWVVNKYKTKEDARTHMGNFCFAFLPNKRKWYRVEVLDWLMEEELENICIQLIDFGETYYCKFEILLPMTLFYSMFPRMAVRCHFAAIYSPDPSKWPESSIEALEQMSEMEAKTEFETIFVCKEGNSYGIDLLNEEKFGKKTLGQILVDSELALQVDISDGLEALEDEDFEEYENINEAITGYDAKDEARLCPFTNAAGGCFKGARCKLEHGVLAKDGVTTDKVLTMNQAFTVTPLPPKGQCVDVLVTGYISTCRFYAQIVTAPSKTSNFNANFQRLRESMNSNNIVHTYEPFKLYPGLGEVVLIKENSEWFRGICVGLAENDKIEVFFVDFGYKREKKLKDLRQMKEDLLYVPFQAVECMLEGCQEKKDAPKNASQTFFDSCMNLKVFKALVVESEEPLRLSMWDSEGMEMGYVLKTCGLGEDRKKDVFPTKDCYLSCN